MYFEPELCLYQFLMRLSDKIFSDFYENVKFRVKFKPYRFDSSGIQLNVHIAYT